MSSTVNMAGYFDVMLDGQEATPELMHALVDTAIELDLNMPSVATLVLNDPTLQLIDAPNLLPGKAIVITAVQGQKKQVVFDGEIVELEPVFTPKSHKVIMRAFDRMHRLTRGRKVRSFQEVTDSDVVEKLAADAGLRAQVVATRVVHPHLWQHNQTDLEFLLERAHLLGYWVHVEGKMLHFEPLPTTTPGREAIELHWGTDVQELSPRMSTMHQAADIIVRGWDPEQKMAIVAEATDSNGNGRARVGETRSGGVLAQEVYNLKAKELVTEQPLQQQAAADALANATAGRAAATFIDADGSCSGRPEIRVGKLLKITGVGDRFSGTYVVTGAEHSYTLQGYRTRFRVSNYSGRTLVGVLQQAVEPKGAQPLGPMIGIVTDNQDPSGQGRVKVKFPWLSEAEASGWARVVAPGAGKERGIEFLPEVNDEVLVVFQNGDINFPLVVGGLWNGMDPPPLASDRAIQRGSVTKRVIRSRDGHTITLDDTSGAGGVTIEDRNGNVIQLESQQNTLTIKIMGNAEIKAGGNLTLECNGQLQVKGGTVEVKGSVINLN